MQLRLHGPDDPRELVLSWEDLEARVAAGRVPGEAWVRAPEVLGEAWHRAADIEWIAALGSSRAAAFARARARAGPPLVTALLVGVQVRVWWLARLPEIQQHVETRWTKWGAPVLEDGEVWRLLTMGLAHTGFAHALLNLAWLAYVGFHLEQALGGRWLVTVFGASVAAGSVASLVGAPGTPSLGASGGIFGLIAATVVFGFVRPEIIPERFRRVFGFALLPYLILMFVSGVLNVGTDNWAHAGGLVTGGLLALVADPPGFDRRPGAGRRAQTAVGVVVATVLAAIAFGGPRLVPLVPEPVARARSAGLAVPAALRPVDGEPDVQVPEGWTPTPDIARTPGWRSPLAPRSWAVAAEVVERPTDPATALAAWRARADAAGWTTSWREPEPDVLAGHPALRIEGEVQDPDPRRVVAWVAVRGTHVLTATWTVEEARGHRLAPLRDRLLAGLLWPDPAALVAARTVPADATAERRRAAADTLARWGEAEAALSLRRSLAAAPGTLADRAALLVTAAWFPDRVPDVEALVAEGLAADAGPRVDAAAAELLRAVEPGAGDALLDLLWARSPGDRTLARARRAAGLSELVVDGVAASTAWDDLDGRLDTASAPAPSLDAARARAARRTTARAARAAEVSAGLDDPGRWVPALVRLAWGHPLPDPTLASVLRPDVERAASGELPPWWHPGLPDAERLRAALAALPDDALAAAAPRWP